MISFAALVSCGAADGGPLPAFACFEGKVPKGTRVSAERARAVLAACQPEMAAWSLSNVENRFHKGLDRKDAEMMEAYDLHREISQEKMLLEITDEIAPTFYSS